MDAYLDIAASVLRAERRPLSPHAILAAAYRQRLVPQHLYGATQHKTLQARLSEDIIRFREHSLFFRTAPGRFFLREFLANPAIREEFRQPVPTRRRFRELKRGPALAIDLSVLRNVIEENRAIDPERVLSLLHGDCYRYADPRAENNIEDVVFFRSFVCVYRENSLLSYRLGRYRDDRDAFMARRSIGFSTLVNIDEHTLFDHRDFGIVSSGVRAVRVDLDIPDVPAAAIAKGNLLHFIWVRGPAMNDLLAVVQLECPTWFEPVKRRLALNDLAWLDTTGPVNNIDDFDPWSRSVLVAYYQGYPPSCQSYAPPKVSLMTRMSST